MATLAFDVYGTLIDTHGVVAELEQCLSSGGKAEMAREFSHRWRDKGSAEQFAFVDGENKIVLRATSKIDLCTYFVGFPA